MNSHFIQSNDNRTIKDIIIHLAEKKGSEESSLTLYLNNDKAWTDKEVRKIYHDLRYYIKIVGLFVFLGIFIFITGLCYWKNWKPSIRSLNHDLGPTQSITMEIPLQDTNSRLEQETAM